MLLYHFPLNTQESIENFINKGIKNDVTIENNSGYSVASDGKVSAKSLLCNGRSLKLPFDNKDKTIAMRLKFPSTLVDSKFLFKVYNSSNTNLKSGPYTWNALGLQLGTTTIVPKSNTNWFDFVMVFTSSGQYAYIDGVLKLTQTNDVSTASYIRILTGTQGTQDYNGYVQDIRIYDYALSRAEINEYSRVLVVHYPLQGNELNGSVLKDVSGFGNDTFGEGTTPFQYVGGSPRAMKWTSFNGDKQQYKVADLVTCMYDNFSVAMWFACDVGSTDQFLLSQGRNWIGSTNDNYGFNIEISANDRLIIKIGGSSIHITDIDLYTIYHVAVTYSNYVCKTYVNGELLNTTTLSLAPVYKSSNTPDVLCIGKVAYGYNFPAGGYYPSYCRQSDVRIYATALSAEDIKNLYNSPISVSNQHQTMAFELKENPLYPSKYWRTPTYDEMYYILNFRTNASNLKGIGRIILSDNVYANGIILLPDNFILPTGLTFTSSLGSFANNSYSLSDWQRMEDNGAVFLRSLGRRGSYGNSFHWFWCGSINSGNSYGRDLYARADMLIVGNGDPRSQGNAVRLVKDGTQFSVSATTKIDFASANLQYHCTQHIWRFAQYSYDTIGADNANISDSYNGWIDLFGYGTSGVNYSPTLHTTTNSDYASGDISNTDNDWGVNEIQSYDYNVKNFALNKNGIVQHNELRENDSEINGCYNNKLITNELIEN